MVSSAHCLNLAPGKSADCGAGQLGLGCVLVGYVSTKVMELAPAKRNPARCRREGPGLLKFELVVSTAQDGKAVPLCTTKFLQVCTDCSPLLVVEKMS